MVRPSLLRRLCCFWVWRGSPPRYFWGKVCLLKGLFSCGMLSVDSFGLAFSRFVLRLINRIAIRRSKYASFLRERFAVFMRVLWVLQRGGGLTGFGGGAGGDGIPQGLKPGLSRVTGLSRVIRPEAEASGYLQATARATANASASARAKAGALHCASRGARYFGRDDGCGGGTGFGVGWRKAYPRG